MSYELKPIFVKRDDNPEQTVTDLTGIDVNELISPDQGSFQVTYKGLPVVTVEVTAEEMQMLLDGAEFSIRVKEKKDSQ